MHTTATLTASGQSTQFNDDGEAKDDWHTTHAQCLTPYCSWAYYLTCWSSILAGTRSLPTCKDLVPSINEPTATLDNDEYNAEKGEPRSLLFDAVTHLGAEAWSRLTRTRSTRIEDGGGPGGNRVASVLGPRSFLATRSTQAVNHSLHEQQALS